MVNPCQCLGVHMYMYVYVCYVYIQVWIPFPCKFVIWEDFVMSTTQVCIWCLKCRTWWRSLIPHTCLTSTASRTHMVRCFIPLIKLWRQWCHDPLLPRDMLRQRQRQWCLGRIFENCADTRQPFLGCMPVCVKWRLCHEEDGRTSICKN